MALRNTIRQMSTHPSTSVQASMRRRIAIIGAGPAGLSAAHQLLSLPTTSSSTSISTLEPELEITLFDRRTNHSGVWAYDPNPGPCIIRYDSSGRAYPIWSGGRKDGDERGKFRPPGAMYDGLRTNLPCDIMSYRSTPYEGGTDLFPDRARVEKYINGFAGSILRLGKKEAEEGEGKTKRRVDVRLGTAVSDVRRINHDPVKGRIGWGSEWNVKSIDITTGKERDEVYDHIVVASGRCNTPTIPYIEALNRFKGEILHSAWYRSPLPFEHRTVLVVGNSSSGSDIARELSGYILRTLPEGLIATQEYISRCQSKPKGQVLHSYENYDKPPPLDYDPRDPTSPEWAKRIQVVPKIERIDEDGEVILEGGERKEGVDVIIFATGYAYDLPYLRQELAPFDLRPLIPLPPFRKAPEKTEEKGEREGEKIGNYHPPTRLAPFLTNLDDWSLFYAPDPSLCVLGAPIRIVPMPLTHVQARIVAAAWLGHLNPAPGSKGLPRLDPNVSTTDPAKWTSTRTPAGEGEGVGEKEEEGNKTSDLGYPADSAYQNALLNLLPEQLRERGRDELTKVPEEDNGVKDGENKGEGEKEQRGLGLKGNGVVGRDLQPVEAKDEGWEKMADFRNQRRADTKRLRRLLLGY